MKKFGVVGHRGKLGSLLIQRADFVPIDCDVTHPASIEYAISRLSEPVDIIVNCAGISSIDECEKDYDKAIIANVHGLHNLHKEFGKKVLNISSDHVFSENLWMPKENKKPSPVSAYSWTKVGAEAVSKVNEGKTIRLSRIVSLFDTDIVEYLRIINGGFEIHVPDFLLRNYLHRKFALDGIEFLVRNWEDIKFPIINYAGTDNLSMYSFMSSLVGGLGLDSTLVKPRDYDNSFEIPRPKLGGLNIGLAKKLGFQMHPIGDTVSELVDDYYA